MSTHPKYWPLEAFEFDDGYRRFVLSRGANRGLAPGYASSVRERYRRNEITAGLGGDEKLVAAVLRDLEAGQLQMSDLDLPRAADCPPLRPST